jgi:DUF4097 and DUF4098 domain-containing protein YvlB
MRMLASLLVLAATLAATPAAATDPDLWQRTVDVPGRPTLRVITDDGRIKIGIWDQKQVGMRVTTRGWHISDSQVRVAESHMSDQVTLEVRAPKFHFDWGWHSSHSVLIEVWVPRGADLDLSSGDGNVSVPGVEGHVAIRTGDGDVRVEDAKGTIELTTGDGRVTATGIDGRLRAHTGDGSMHIDGRFEGLDLTTGDGSITADVLPGSTVSDRWAMTTGDGSLTLMIPKDLKANLTAHSGDGGITVDAPMTLEGRITRHDVHGSLNGGGAPLTMRTGDGSIRLGVH